MIEKIKQIKAALFGINDPNADYPFNGDKFILEEFAKLINNYNIQTIIETGTYKGATTECLAMLAEYVITIENNELYYMSAKKRLSKYNNIALFKGSSPKVLNNSVLNSSYLFIKPILFFLDAHWYSYNPLLDELKTIAKFGLNNSVIAIHDFKVPNKNFGYDNYNNMDYCWEYIEKDIEKIYGEKNYSYYYNEEAEGAKRGIIYITPKNL